MPSKSGGRPLFRMDRYQEVLKVLLENTIEARGKIRASEVGYLGTAAKCFGRLR